MTSSALVEIVDARIADVWFEDAMVRVRLTDGREVSAPCEWFPRLRDAGEAARKNWRLIGQGLGVHWPDIDEDISLNTLLRQR